jgi:hypothetical protein
LYNDFKFNIITMNTSKEIREAIGEAKNRLVAIDALLTKENRNYTDAEQTTWDADEARIAELEAELVKVEKREAVRLSAVAGAPVQTTSKEERKAVETFSFMDAVRGVYGEKLNGLAAEMHQEGLREMKGIGVTNRGSSIIIPGVMLRANIVENGTAGVDQLGFVDGVYASTILGDLGVTQLKQQMDARLTVLPSVSTQWEGETDAAADGGAAITPISLTPKRLAAYANFSMQAAMQQNESLEAALRRSFQEAIAAKVEYAAFTDDTANGSYEWLGNGKTPVTNAAISALILAAIEEVQDNNHNRGNLGFAISNDLFSDVYTAAQVSGVNPLIVNEMIMGKMAKFSNQIAAITNPALYYGDWSKVYLAQFGGLEITLDTFTQKKSGMDVLIVNSFWDMALAQDAALSVGTLG